MNEIVSKDFTRRIIKIEDDIRTLMDVIRRLDETIHLKKIGHQNKHLSRLQKQSRWLFALAASALCVALWALLIMVLG